MSGIVVLLWMKMTTTVEMIQDLIILQKHMTKFLGSQYFSQTFCSSLGVFFSCLRFSFSPVIWEETSPKRMAFQDWDCLPSSQAFMRLELPTTHGEEPKDIGSPLFLTIEVFIVFTAHLFPRISFLVTYFKEVLIL